MNDFSPRDLAQLDSVQIDHGRAADQLARLRAGQVATRLERPCTPGDGILRLRTEEHADLEKAFAAAVEAGRLQRFVPASGAASRMFSQLHADTGLLEACRSAAAAAEAGPAELTLRRFRDELPAFAFYADLRQAMADDGLDLEQVRAARDLATLIRYLLEPCGLGYASLPKGLLAFHAVADGARTPFIEHLAEAALLGGSERTVVLHFTVSVEHLPLFKAQLAAWRATLEETYGCHFDVSFSTQKPSTDTLALDADGRPLRGADGRLVLRPGGHGALVENLGERRGDIILVRNIDNVVPDSLKQTNLHWTRLLTGCLLNVQRQLHDLLAALHAQPGDPQLHRQAEEFLADRLQVPVAAGLDGDALVALLDRPLRVCGVVPNSGEPGGGPFWVRDRRGGLSRQIVESAQVDLGDPGQAAILARSTHFNPVDMACAVSDWRGRPYDLARFIDEDAVIVTGKTQGGRQIRVLERPGLWNGGMAGWHTLFVEIPPAAFNPVKTVFDLLRPAHRG